MIKLLYLIITTIGIISSFKILTSLNPISRLAYLIKVFIKSAFIFLLLDNYFLGLTYIIVYVGAIAILFLFVIMMTETLLIPSNSSLNNSNLGYSLLVIQFILFNLIAYPHLKDDSNFQFNNEDIYNFFYTSYSSEFINFTDIQSLGFFIFLSFPFIIVLIGILLWCVLVGIIRISNKN